MSQVLTVVLFALHSRKFIVFNPKLIVITILACYALLKLSRLPEFSGQENAHLRVSLGSNA